MLQRLFLIAAVLSLAMCVVTVALWAWSVNGAHGTVLGVGRWNFVSVVSNRGVVGVEIQVIVPHWGIAAVTAVLPLAWAASRIRRRRQHNQPMQWIGAAGAFPVISASNDRGPGH
ncbi:MAG TPA: hypothetical protein VGR35_01115 [Tepidisphaeraceae bacterium]|nr:hypothetical protein [Tepidisphaeraceae bacterium]